MKSDRSPLTGLPVLGGLMRLSKPCPQAYLKSLPSTVQLALLRLTVIC
jgi:hypothetical protein